MARILSVAGKPLFSTTVALSNASMVASSRSYISEMRRSAIKDNLLRILRTEITYESEYRPPRPPATSFDSFSVEDRLGEQWIRLRRKFGEVEDIKIDATMFDGAIPSGPPAAEGGEEDPRLHMSLVVEVSKGEASGFVLQFVCSAWQDSLDVVKVYPVSRRRAALRPYMGPNFKELDEEMQEAIRSYLEERGVNDDLAEFLHEYMINKDKAEFIRWMKNVEAYVKK